MTAVQRAGLLAVAAGVLAAAVGCTGSSGGGTSAGSCSGDPRGLHYAPGMAVSGSAGLLRITLDSANPAPPNLGDNAWVFTVTKVAGGAALSGCTITAVPTMPDMQHGTYPPPVVTTDGQAGGYHATPINMFMGGLWQVAFIANCPGASDLVLYDFCIQG